MNIVFLDDAFSDEEKYGSRMDNFFKKDHSSKDIILRTWMLSRKEYADIQLDFKNKGYNLLVSFDDYVRTHFLPEWYPEISDFTFETKIFNNDEDIRIWIKTTDWNSFFIKDEIKSLTTKRGSVAKNKDEIWDVIKELRYYGTTGDICIRKYHELEHESERRHFVFNKEIYSEDNNINDDIRKKMLEFNSPFFSFDTIKDTNGKQWIVEIGNGQVSSFKWKNSSIANFYKDIKKDFNYETTFSY